MRYFIYAPIWHHKSSGLKVLYNLQKLLIQRGYDCIYYSFGGACLGEISDDDWVIYPEIVKGNPLNAKNVIRYVLYTPGVNGGDVVYDSSELVITHDHKWYMNVPELFVPHIDALFVDLNLPKKHNCIWRYKGNYKPWFQLSGIEITLDYPKTTKELVKLLQECDILYTYDEHTTLAEEARACGAKVKIINIDGSFSDYIHTYTPEKLDGQLDEFIRITQK